MITTIISHNVSTAKARIKFEHNGVVLENDFTLKDVIPGTKYIFEMMEIEFDEGYQLKAIEKLGESIQRQIEEGYIVNMEPLQTDIPPVEGPVTEESTE